MFIYIIICLFTLFIYDNINQFFKYKNVRESYENVRCECKKSF